jgi:hypothetical protein
MGGKEVLTYVNAGLEYFKQLSSQRSFEKPFR